MAADNKPSPELSKIDQAIAADADALLQGDFETIDTVLEGVFEEQAALVQMDDKSPAANPRALASSRAATPPVPTAPVVAPTPTPEPIAVVPPVEAKPSEPAAAATAAVEEPIEEAAIDSAPAIVSAPPIPRDAAVPTEVAPSPAIKLSTQRPQIITTLKQFAVTALMAFNYPMRFVPVGQRPLVDWVALSLIGWVPVVWILALTLGHKNAHVQASPEVHQAGSVLATTEVEDKAMHEVAEYPSQSTTDN